MPVESEKAIMLCCGTDDPEKKEQRIRDNQITKMIEQDKRKYRSTHRLLLLGKKGESRMTPAYYSGTCLINHVMSFNENTSTLYMGFRQSILQTFLILKCLNNV